MKGEGFFSFSFSGKREGAFDAALAVGDAERGDMEGAVLPDDDDELTIEQAHPRLGERLQ